jgi:hypothetical protein
MLARTTMLALGVAVLATVAAGCGGGSGNPGVANIGGATTSTTPAASGNAAPSPGGASGATAFVAFVDCMQKHGVQAQLGPGGKGVSITGGSGPNSPQLTKAQAACRKLLPGGGPKPLTPAEQAQNLKGLVVLAACMRSHGYPDFPDPTSQGFFNLSNVNPNSTQFQNAMTTCTPRGSHLRIGIRSSSISQAPGG